MAPVADVACEPERLGREVTRLAHVSGFEQRPREIGQRQRHPRYVAHLSADAVALLVEDARKLHVLLAGPYAEVVQDRAEDERIPRLLGEHPGLFEQHRALVEPIV